MRAFAGLVVGAALFASPAFAAEGPFTEAQVKKGLSEYNTHCRTCHAKEGKGALGPALVGDQFKSHFGGQTAADVRTWIHDFMPQTAPKSLKDEQLDPLLAYILSLNGYTPGSTEFSAETGKSLTIEGK
ncbi:c-type cytochrome [Methylopila musalis]|uniref:C-type cytochrome n=1 Tax=Methylopila musalis TaxID=1134781 RepID=A0ABW3ZAP2_9HYPH